MIGALVTGVQTVARPVWSCLLRCGKLALPILPLWVRVSMRSMGEGHARCFLSSLYVTLLRPFPSTTFGGPPPRAGEDRPQPAAFRPSSSRAQAAAQTKKGAAMPRRPFHDQDPERETVLLDNVALHPLALHLAGPADGGEIGRASGRERGCQCV